jgi:hypothetical protein
MTTTETVALIGAIATPVIAIAGYGFNVWRAAQDRRSAKELAADAQAHELRVAQRSRAYADGKEAYMSVTAWAVRTMHQVELTLPALSGKDPPKPPENIPVEEYEAMNAAVALFGSSTVADKMVEFQAALQVFRANVWAYHAAREGPGTSDQFTPFTDVEKARQTLRDAFGELTTTMHEELYGP